MFYRIKTLIQIKRKLKEENFKIGYFKDRAHWKWI